jgi:uncharacterized protein
MMDVAERTVVVGRAINGWTTVFEQMSVETKHRRRIAREVSARLSTVVFTWEIADDDVTRCHLWDAGRHRLEFDSWPDYDGNDVSDSVRRRKAGSPAILLEYCVEGTTREAVRSALRQSGEEPAFVMETDRVHALAPLLGIDESAAEASFDDVAEDASEGTKRYWRIEGKHDPRVSQFRRRLYAREYDVVLEWLRDGLDPNARDEKGIDLFSDALNERAWPVMRALVEAGINPERALHWCARESAEELVWLLGRVRDVDAFDPTGATPLLSAVFAENCDAARALIDAGAKINRQHHLTYRVPPRVIIGRTALMTAARGGDLAMVQLLLARGADRSLQDADGWTARDFAVSRGHLDVAAILEERVA